MTGPISSVRWCSTRKNFTVAMLTNLAQFLLCFIKALSMINGISLLDIRSRRLGNPVGVDKFF